MRYRVHLQYLGTAYAGWQRQPNDVTVQQVLEETLSTILREKIEVTGCGRTDAGVHARQYVAHFDAMSIENFDKVLYQWNAILPYDISVLQLMPAKDDFHARFDAVSRSYTYHLHFQKNPFLQNQSFYFQQSRDLDIEKMMAAASLLLSYEQFKPFCKTGSDANHYICYLKNAVWHFFQDGATFTIDANRFLRGMVRLIVGTQLQIGLGKISLTELKYSLDTQEPIPFAWSVPPEGLFLEKIIYAD